MTPNSFWSPNAYNHVKNHPVNFYFIGDFFFAIPESLVMHKNLFLGGYSNNELDRQCTLQSRLSYGGGGGGGGAGISPQTQN